MKANKRLSKIKGAQFYKIGDKVEAIKKDIGAWFVADIIDIHPNSKCECLEECRCTYKLLFEGEEDDDLQIVERKLNEIRQVSYSSVDWDKLQVGMKVVINYNIDKPKQWGYWYDYVIEDLQKRDDVIYLKGTLLVGYEGSSKKIPVRIDSDNVADVLAIRPHATLVEKQSENYETGVKPEYCKKCRNKPKVKCRTCCCCKCGTKKDFQLTVQCDECGDWYHIYCLDPPLQQLPDDEDWYCPKCSNEYRRAKLEMKLKLKKEKRAKKEEKKPTKKHKEVEGNEEKQKKPKLATISETIITPNKHTKDDKIKEEEEDEMIPEIKEIPSSSKIWSEVENLYKGYDILRITVECAKKRNFEEILSPTVDDLISKDVVNEHLWNEAKEHIKNGKEAFLETVKRLFTCAICCDVMDAPITLSCKHSFCIDCFFRSLSVNVYNCALCRIDVIHTQHYVVNENLNKALALLFGRKLSKKIDA